MRHKKHLLLSIALGFSCFSFSQTFMQGIGVNFVFQSVSGYTVKPVVAIIYSPKFSFIEKANSSLSVGLPLSLAFAGIFNTPGGNENNKTIGWMLDAPLIFNYNYGSGSNKKTDRGFGFFAGAGYGYHTDTYTNNNDDLAHFQSGFGPVYNTGIRLATGKDRHHNIEIRFSYMKTMDDSKSNIFGTAAIFNY